MVACGAGALGGCWAKIVAAGGRQGEEDFDIVEQSGASGQGEGGIAEVGVLIDIEEVDQEGERLGIWKPRGHCKRAEPIWAEVLKIGEGQEPANEVGLVGALGGRRGHERSHSALVRRAGAKFGKGKHFDTGGGSLGNGGHERVRKGALWRGGLWSQYRAQEDSSDMS